MEVSWKGLVHGGKEISPSIIGEPWLSKSSRHKGVIFAVTPPNTAELINFKTPFQNFSVFVEFETFNFYISLGSVRNLTKKLGNVNSLY